MSAYEGLPQAVTRLLVHAVPDVCFHCPSRDFTLPFRGTSHSCLASHFRSLPLVYPLVCHLPLDVSLPSRKHSTHFFPRAASPSGCRRGLPRSDRDDALFRFLFLCEAIVVLCSLAALLPPFLLPPVPPTSVFESLRFTILLLLGSRIVLRFPHTSASASLSFLFNPPLKGDGQLIPRVPQCPSY